MVSGSISDAACRPAGFHRPTERSLGTQKAYRWWDDRAGGGNLAGGSSAALALLDSRSPAARYRHGDGVPHVAGSISDVAHPEWRATTMGVYRFWRDLGYAVGALISGIIADLLGMRAAVQVVAALTLLSGLQVAFRMRETLVGQSTKEFNRVPSPAARL
jgi:MFS family permease